MKNCKYCKTELGKKKLYKRGFEMDYCKKCGYLFRHIECTKRAFCNIINS